MNKKLAWGLGIGGVILGIGVIGALSGGSSKTSDSGSQQTATPLAALTVTPSPTATAVPTPTATATPSGPRTSLGDGTWRVGTDIVAGTYRTENTSGSLCYYARLSGFSGGLNDILANGIPQGPTVITIAPSDAGFLSRRCSAWTLQP